MNAIIFGLSGIASVRSDIGSVICTMSPAFHVRSSVRYEPGLEVTFSARPFTATVAVFAQNG